MATNQSATAQDITDELISGMPEGFTDLMDMQDPDGPGPLFAALGEVLATVAIDRVDDLRDQLSPMTCGDDTLTQWESALSLTASRLARAGTTAQRRAQVIARLREWGAPTLDLIRRVVYSYLGYTTPADVVILESDRDALRSLHTYRWTGSRSIGPVSTDLIVADGGTVGPGGAAVDLCCSTDELASFAVTVYAPDGTLYSRVGVGRGALSTGRAWASVTSGTAVTLSGVWGDGTSVWFVGASGTIIRWDGSAMNAETSGTANALNSVWGDGGVVWTAGASGTVLKRSAGTWGTITSGTAVALNGVFAAFGSVWVVGVSGVIRTSSDGGGTWTAQTSGTAQQLRAIWGTGGTSAADIKLWAVGANGVILYSPDGGTTWTAQTSGTTETLYSVRGTSATDVWVGGTTDALLRLDALGVWNVVASSTGNTYRAVAPTGAVEPAVAYPASTQVWCIGTTGTLRSADKTSTYDAVSPVSTSLLAGWTVSQNDAWVCGASGVILRMQDTGGGRVRVYFPEFEGLDIAGTWTVSVNGDGTGVLSQVDLFVEGAGLDSGGASGRGTAAAWWGVMFEPSKSAGGYDLDAARLAVARLTMACRWSNILRRSEGAGALAAGSFGAIPGDDGSLPGACVPGT